MIKTGIDLSTTNIGVVRLNSRGRILCRKTFKMLSYSQENMYKNIQILKEISMECNGMIGIEVSNFSNPMLTQRFSEYSGILQGILQTETDEYGYPSGDYIIKVFNSNSWQYLIGCKPSDNRDERKWKAHAFVCEKLGSEFLDWTQDEYDAFCIAYFLEEIETTEDKREKGKNDLKIKNKMKKMKIKRKMKLKK